jgi:hypothetical protein
MNITRIGTSYTLARQAQNVNFASIWVYDWVKEHCGLTDSDISALNSRCPRNLNIEVVDHGTDGQHTEVCRAKINDGEFYYNKDFDVYYNCRDEYNGKRSSKSNFMKCMEEIFDSYHKKTDNSNSDSDNSKSQDNLYYNNPRMAKLFR